MISLRVDEIFSGDGDQLVAVSLPLAYLKACVNCLSEPIQWYGDDWVPDDPTSEQLSIIEAGQAAVTAVLNEE